MLKKKYIFYSPVSFLNTFLSLPSLLCFSISALSSLRTQRHLFSLSLLWLWFLAVMVVVFGCARSLKGVVGRGWVRCGLWVVGRRGCGSVVVVDRRGCGLWVMDRRGWVVVVDRRARMKRVIGRGSAAEGGRWLWIGG